MTLFASILNKIQKKFTDYCEFSSTCPYFNPDNFTCCNGGGAHCGKYRRFKAEKTLNETAKTQKRTN
jgi:hypothetical protein